MRLTTDAELASGHCEAVAALVAQAGLGGRFDLLPLTGGGNNRVFRVEAEGTRALLKVYFQHPNDPRDRLGVEFAFTRFAWQQGLTSLPRPLACDTDHQLGLYEYIAGRRPLPDDIAANSVDQALNFYRDLNRCKNLPVTRTLSNASEACFSLREHVHCVDHRVQRLRAIDARDDLARDTIDFVRRELAPAWDEISGSLPGSAARQGLCWNDEVPMEARCLSPSDFGFHNALIDCQGRFRFIDFEYAGWDDPAKMVCDFFCQPAVPAPSCYYERFAASVCADLPDSEKQLTRIDLLRPVYRIKWCCILLNHFLPVGRERRRFAGNANSQDEQRAVQLHKARKALVA